MSKKGLDFEKLNKFQNIFDEDIESIKNELTKKLHSLGGLIYEKTGINPDPEMFVNWFIDNHYQPKKRRFPLKFSNEMLYDFCELYREEEEEKSSKFFKKDYTNELKKDVEEIFRRVFKLDNTITENNIMILIDEALYILNNLKLPPNSEPLPKKDINTKTTYLRYCYHEIQGLKTNQSQELWVFYLHFKFEEQFQNNYFDPLSISKSTVYKKFANCPKGYPQKKG